MRFIILRLCKICTAHLFLSKEKSCPVSASRATARNAKSYLEKGHKIKVAVRFKGRQLAHPELGRDVIMRFAERLSDVSEIEVMPKMEGRSMQLFLTPKK